MPNGAIPGGSGISAIGPNGAPMEVIVHPIVLLSVVDHYDRIAKGTSKRVVGTLLGEVRDDKLHIMSSFAVPFEEDRDPTVWFLDHNYHEQLSYMSNKVNAKERVVGWYSSGPKIKPADLQIHEVYRSYVKEPLFVILDVSPGSVDIMEAYYSVQEKTHDERFSRTFRSVQATFGADEAEEVGTEHLLRDIRNRSTSTLAARVHQKCESQRTLIAKLEEIQSYLSSIRSGKYPYSTKIVDALQEIFHKLPESVAVGPEAGGGATGALLPSSSTALARGPSSTGSLSTVGAAGGVEKPSQFAHNLSQEANDQYLGLYMGSILRSVLTLHDLVNNKIAAKDFLKEAEEKKLAEEKQAKLEKEKGKVKAEAAK